MITKLSKLAILAAGSVFLENPIFAADSPTNEIGDLQAKGQFAFSHHDYDQAIKCFDRLIELGEGDAFIGRAMVYNSKKEYDKAISDLNERIQHHPKASTSGVAFETRGNAYAEKGDHAKAVNDYTESINRKPKDGYVYWARAEEYAKLNSFGAALIDCNMAILILSDEPNHRNWLEAAFVLRASIFIRLGKNERAYDDCSKVIENNPTNIYAFNIRGRAGLGLGKYDKSISDFQIALRLNLKDEVAYRFLGWIMAACPDAKYRNGQKALEYAMTACEMTGWKDPLNLITIAAAYAEIGDFEQAVTWEQKAIASGLKEQDLIDSQERLELYKQKKPFRIKTPTMTK